MKVILLQDIKGLGKEMDLKEVRDGYARNYLIPKKLALAVTPENLNLKEQLTKAQQETLRKLTDRAKKLENISLEFGVKTGSKGEVFGSVKAEDIKKHLREQGLGEGEPVLAKPLKALGEHVVPVDFGRGIKSKVKVILHSQ